MCNVELLKEVLTNVIKGNCSRKNKISYLIEKDNLDCKLKVIKDVIIVEDIVFNCDYKQYKSETLCSELIFKLSRICEDFYTKNVIVCGKYISGNKFSCVSYKDKHLIAEVNNISFDEILDKFNKLSKVI